MPTNDRAVTGNATMDDIEISPRFVVNNEGVRTEVILKIDEFSRMLEAIEELQDIQDYDEAKATATEFITLDELRKRVEAV